MSKEVIVKKMNDKLIKLALKKDRADAKAETSLFFSVYFKTKREKVRREFWIAVREEFSDLANMDADIRYDNTIAFKPYKID